MLFFTSDLHFDHAGIIHHCHRPFHDVEEMNEALIARFNERVSDKDEVYFLGDFAFRNPALFLARLKGKRHHLILGNHDYKRLPGIKEAAFYSVQDVLYLRHEGMRFFLSHYAHRTWRNSVHGSYHLYGHSHGSLPSFNRSMDVGVDCCNYYPISLDEILEVLKDQPA
jgi:calcineurin-like phosphoesterase family protein